MGWSSCYWVKAIILVVLSLWGTTSFAQNTICPFDYFYHLGDGVFDIGNAVRVQPYGKHLPAIRFPYGVTNPGYPTGRWSDGLTDIDLGGAAMGFPVMRPYLAGNITSANNGIIFAVARSPVLDLSFFRSRGIQNIPPYAIPLSIQMGWFRQYLSTVCSTPQDCARQLQNSIFFFGDVEGHDIAYPLIQGKSIEEVRTYVKFVTQAQINAAREIIGMGASRVLLTGNTPVGCYPYILTELAKDDPTAYDDLGCLKSVNDLVIFKNNDLQQAIDNLRQQYPNVTIFYGNFYDAFRTILQETTSAGGPDAEVALKACCGIGGKYNYDSKRMCGTNNGVPFCSNPKQYIHWDGIHLTQEATTRLTNILQRGALQALNCTPPHSS